MLFAVFYTLHFPFRASLHCKWTTVGRQMDYSCNVNVVQLERKSCPFAAKRSFFAFVIFIDFLVRRHNSLYISNITKPLQNSRISSQRILCAFSTQFLAVRNANIVCLIRFVLYYQIFFVYSHRNRKQSRAWHENYIL